MAIALPMVSAKKPRQARPPSKKAAERAAATDQAGRHLYFRFNVIRARMQAHIGNIHRWLRTEAMIANRGIEGNLPFLALFVFDYYWAGFGTLVQEYQGRLR